MRARALLSLVALIAWGCQDGVGRPILTNESSNVGSSAGTNAGVSSGTSGSSSGGSAAGVAGAGGASGGSAGSQSGGTAGDIGGTTGGATGAIAGFGPGEFGRPPWEEFGGWGGEFGERGDPDDPDWDGAMGGGVPPSSHCASVSAWDGREEALEQELFGFLNFARESGVACAGEPGTAVPALTMRPELRCAARLHSRDMSERDFFGHVNPDGVGPEDRMRRAGYSFGVASESIARDDMMQGFMVPYDVLVELFSTGGSGCRNLVESRFDSVGIGFFEGFWTLDFAGR